mmetsp:Transcript_114883/g.228658  ORF Transcript_114883/g.228658 Transcript_114883/m.228658 type:complete len:91 (+) Transcript_114883:2482-2754(+)
MMQWQCVVAGPMVVMRVKVVSVKVKRNDPCTRCRDVDAGIRMVIGRPIEWAIWPNALRNCNQQWQQAAELAPWNFHGAARLGSKREGNLR